MTKVSVGLGMTLKLSSGGGFNMFKPEILIADIDLDHPTVSPDDQLQEAIDYIGTVYGQVEGKMSEIIEGSEIEEKRELVTELSKVSQDLNVRVRKLELGVPTKTTETEEVKEAVVKSADKDHGW